MEAIFLIFFIVNFSCFISPSASSYLVPEKYFINCGSSLNTSFNGHNFIGDESSGKSFTFSGNGSSSVSITNTPSSLPLLYQTSRIFTQTSSYQLGIDQSGIYILRLHFFPILYHYLSVFNASFSVFTSDNLPLLSNFRVGRHPTLPETHEFDVYIKVGTFGITFEPLQESAAFITAIEVFLPPTNSTKDSASGVIVASVTGGSIVIIVSVAVLIFVLRRGKTKPNNQLMESSNHSLKDLNLDLRLPFSAIKSATVNFNPKFIIGEGGFGKVYSGILNGKKVAVKRSEIGHGQGLSEFYAEINVLSRLGHRHLVSLIGYCDEGREMILVYEFMGKGTLREHLYKTINDSLGNYCMPETQLSWEKRLEICIGAANGLHYLHGCLDGSIIHRDVKSTNILLDEDYTPKVSDFGLSKQSHFDQTHVSTGVKGSFGYYDPEYFLSGKLTQKSDVYSFGVVLVEVLCARPVINVSLPEEQINLPQWALHQLKNGLLETIIDPFLVGKINPNSLRTYTEIFQKCLEDNSTDRPSMLDVAWNLEFALRLQRPIISGENECTTTDVSVNLPSIVLNDLPSYSNPFSDIRRHEDSEDMESNYTDASQVFSQLKMDEAR